MNKKSLFEKSIKPICITLAVILGGVSIAELWHGGALDVYAAEDTLPGIAQMRTEIMESENEVYEILELVPQSFTQGGDVLSYPGGTLGFYISGQEPFPSLYDVEEKEYRSWKSILSSFRDTQESTAKEKRRDFMDRLEREASYVLENVISQGEAPFSFESYHEVSEQEYELNPSLYEGYTVMEGDSVSKIGYLQYEEGGDWYALFEAAPGNLLVEEVYEGRTVSYYSVKESIQYTYEQLYQMYEDMQDEFIPLYSLRNDGRTYEHAGDVISAWESVFGEDKLFTVSAGDGVTGDGEDAFSVIVPVSGGDQYPELTDLSPFYSLSFQIINDGTAVAPTNPEDVIHSVYVLDYFSFVNGKGDYEVYQADGNLTAVTEFVEPGEYVYYKGGIVNHDLFKRKVLGLSLEECEYFNTKVRVVTADMLNQSCYDINGDWVPSESVYFKGMDFLFVNGSAEMTGVYGATNPYGNVGDLTGTFSHTGNAGQYDLMYETMKYMAEIITKNEIGCVIDLSSFAKEELYSSRYSYGYAGGENIGKLVGFLLYSQTERLEFMTTVSKFEDTLQNISVSSVVEGYRNSSNRVFAPDEDDKDLCFVKDNIWFWNNTPENGFLHGGALEKYHYNNGDGSVSSSFSPVYDEIVMENLYREADSGYTEGLLSTEIYEKTVWRYIVNYSRRRPTGDKYANEKLKVLVLEPATNNTAKIDISKNDIHKWTGVAQEKIVWEVMSVNQFIGCIDDMNSKYDLVYIGASMDKFYTTTLNGRTITRYNDSNMNGLLYSHVGDLQKGLPTLAGLLDKDYVDPLHKETSNLAISVSEETYRYSGNDITLEKYNALMDFVDAAYPVILADELVVKDSSGKYSANDYTVDNSSYLYEFINVALEKENVFAREELPDITSEANSKNSLFDFYINKPKLKIVVGDTRYPDIITTTDKYDYVLNNTTVTNEEITQISRDMDGNYYLQYKFQIENYGAVSYDENYGCKLYLDANADGKFSNEYEQLSVDITEADSGRRLSGQEKSRLKQDKVYIVSARVPETYYGCITWKLEIMQTDNPYIRSSKKGYTKLKTESPAAEINILQIYFNDTRSSINLQHSIGTWNEASGSYIKGSNATNYFNDLANAVKDDYRLNITTISKTEFDNGYRNGNARDLLQYDMLILGFSDAKNGTDWEYGVTGENSIQEFIQSGKSVLMAHDMTSYVNVDNQTAKVDGYSGTSYYLIGKGNEYYWNYQMNKSIRDLVGMDMYGITNDSFNSQIKMGYSLNVEESNLRIPYKDSNGRYKYSYEYRDENGNLSVSTIKDIAYTPRSGRSTTVPEVHGYEDIALNQRTSKNWANDGYGLYRKGFTETQENRYSTSALCINEGQITTYPFNVGAVRSNQLSNDSFEQETVLGLKTTHNQYYTLDMNADSDNDGQTDIVVWYTLDGGEYNNNYGDVVNNYYIYSKGNVIYTGMGHSAMSNNYANAVTQEEAKLFINTIIAAYNTGTKTPYITTMDGRGVETQTIYNYFDSLIDRTSVGNVRYEITEGEATVDLGFRISDLNMTQGAKSSQVKYYIEVGDEAAVWALLNEFPSYGAGIYELSTVPTSSYPALPDYSGTVNGGVFVLDVTNYLIQNTQIEGGSQHGIDMNTIEIGANYYVKVPIKYFNANANGFDTEFYVGAKTTMVKSSITGSEIVTNTPWGYQSLKYVNVELFDLD